MRGTWHRYGMGSVRLRYQEGGRLCPAVSSTAVLSRPVGFCIYQVATRMHIMMTPLPLYFSSSISHL